MCPEHPCNAITEEQNTDEGNEEGSGSCQATSLAHLCLLWWQQQRCGQSYLATRWAANSHFFELGHSCGHLAASPTQEPLSVKLQGQS